MFFRRKNSEIKGRKILLFPINLPTHSQTKQRTSTSIAVMTPIHQELAEPRQCRLETASERSRISSPNTINIVVEPFEMKEPPRGRIGEETCIERATLTPEKNTLKSNSPLNYKYCHICEAPIKPSVELRIGPTNWALSTLVCTLGCFMGCCLIPFFTDAAKDKVEVCSLCKNVLS